MTWEEIQKCSPIILNLGGRHDHHPDPRFLNTISVENWMEGEQEEDSAWTVHHDLSKPIPLPERSVDRILTEHFLHYLDEETALHILQECYRLLKPGGLLRIAVPDYASPKDRKFLLSGTDPRYPKHRILFTREVMETMIRQSPFRKWTFLHYWQGNTFMRHTMEDRLGYVHRTPDHDPRCSSVGSCRWRLRNLLFFIQKGFYIPKHERCFLRGDPLHITSLVVDLRKESSTEA